MKDDDDPVPGAGIVVLGSEGEIRVAISIDISDPGQRLSEMTAVENGHADLVAFDDGIRARGEQGVDHDRVMRSVVFDNQLQQASGRKLRSYREKLASSVARDGSSVREHSATGHQQAQPASHPESAGLPDRELEDDGSLPVGFV